ncbi:hypothetical protein AB0J82_39120 [Asanoa sp. NPDC049518]|uniref:hypothetical protein n=1 Tax=unclassified Asanoa TaxID=2685164 RepID=UPI0034246AA5
MAKNRSKEAAKPAGAPDSGYARRNMIVSVISLVVSVVVGVSGVIYAALDRKDRDRQRRDDRTIAMYERYYDGVREYHSQTGAWKECEWRNEQDRSSEIEAECRTLAIQMSQSDKDAADLRDDVIEAGPEVIDKAAMHVYEAALSFRRDGNDAATLPAYQEALGAYRRAMNEQIRLLR